MAMIINIFTNTQQLILLQDDKIMRNYVISTAKNGIGEIKGSQMTPRGWHEIRAKIGNNCPVNTVFVGRRPTGEVYSPELTKKYPGRDWILTRILWLSGLEPGLNRMGIRDTFKRYIYIHGCPDQTSLGRPSSHGCIRMRNDDIIELFDLVPPRTPVLITAEDRAITKA